MEEKKRKCRRKRDPYYGSVFAPLFPNHIGTPKTTPDAGVPAPPSPVPESVVPRSRERMLYEMRKGLGLLKEVNDGNSGYGAPNAMMIAPLQGSPMPTGPGFGADQVPGQGGKYDFKRSPGIGFKTENGWKVWRAAMELAPASSHLSVDGIVQAAMSRAGVRFGDIDPSEMSLLNMGVEWYLGSPGQPGETAGISGFGEPNGPTGTTGGR